MQTEWKIIVTRIREGKELLRIMNGEWKIILYRVLESLEKDASRMEDYCDSYSWNERVAANYGNVQATIFEI